MKNILEVSKADVMEVYSGRPGCACGCQGKYSVNPAHKALADAKRGYVLDDNINMAQVSRVLKIVQEAASVNPSSVKYTESDGLGVYSFDTPERYRWVYVPLA